MRPHWVQGGPSRATAGSRSFRQQRVSNQSQEQKTRHV